MDSNIEPEIKVSIYLFRIEYILKIQILLYIHAQLTFSLASWIAVILVSLIRIKVVTCLLAGHKLTSYLNSVDTDNGLLFLPYSA